MTRSDYETVAISLCNEHEHLIGQPFVTQAGLLLVEIGRAGRLDCRWFDRSRLLGEAEVDMALVRLSVTGRTGIEVSAGGPDAR